MVLYHIVLYPHIYHTSPFTLSEMESHCSFEKRHEAQRDIVLATVISPLDYCNSLTWPSAATLVPYSLFSTEQQTIFLKCQIDPWFLSHMLISLYNGPATCIPRVLAQSPLMNLIGWESGLWLRLSNWEEAAKLCLNSIFTVTIIDNALVEYFMFWLYVFTSITSSWMRPSPFPWKAPWIPRELSCLHLSTLYTLPLSHCGRMKIATNSLKLLSWRSGGVSPLFLELGWALWLLTNRILGSDAMPVSRLRP